MYGCRFGETAAAAAAETEQIEIKIDKRRLMSERERGGGGGKRLVPSDANNTLVWCILLSCTRMPSSYTYEPSIRVFALCICSHYSRTLFYEFLQTKIKKKKTENVLIDSRQSSGALKYARAGVYLKSNKIHVPL